MDVETEIRELQAKYNSIINLLEQLRPSPGASLTFDAVATFRADIEAHFERLHKRLALTESLSAARFEALTAKLDALLQKSNGK